MSVLDIIIAPDSRLSAMCTEVKPNTPHVRRLAVDLVDTMYAKRGQGLAAPQVGETLRMFCMRYGDNAIVMCNPRITRRGKDVVKDDEGCLSIPYQRVFVDRHKIITVQWRAPDGTTHSAKMRGLDARCVQHEIDHLDGKLIIAVAETEGA